MYINSAEEISGIPASWPGYDLDIGASGMKVRQIQEQLNTIGEVYTEVPRNRWMAYTESERKKQYGSFSPFLDWDRQESLIIRPGIRSRKSMWNHENRRAILKELFLFTDKIPRSVLPGTEGTGTGKMSVIEALPF